MTTNTPVSLCGRLDLGKLPHNTSKISVRGNTKYSPSFHGYDRKLLLSVLVIPSSGWAGSDALAALRLLRPEKLAGSLCGNMLSHKIYGSSCSRQSQKYHHGDGFGYYCIFRLLLWHSQQGKKRGWEHLHFHPQLQQGAFWGFWCVGIQRGGEQAPITSQLATLAGK